MTVIVDTNVFVSALLGSPSCEKIIQAFIDSAFRLAISPILFAELKSVLDRPKFAHAISAEEKEEILEFIRAHAAAVNPKTKIAICRDIKDNMLLEAAVTAKAKYIITGDKDLLTLKRFRKSKILTPLEFLKKL